MLGTMPASITLDDSPLYAAANVAAPRVRIRRVVVVENRGRIRHALSAEIRSRRRPCKRRIALASICKRGPYRDRSGRAPAYSAYGFSSSGRIPPAAKIVRARQRSSDSPCIAANSTAFTAMRVTAHSAQIFRADSGPQTSSCRSQYLQYAVRGLPVPIHPSIYDRGSPLCRKGVEPPRAGYTVTHATQNRRDYRCRLLAAGFAKRRAEDQRRHPARIDGSRR